MTNEKTKIPVRGTIYSNQLPQLSMQMSTNANTNVECNGKLTEYKHFFLSNVPNFTYFLFWHILNTSIVLLSNFSHSTFFWQILHTSVTIFLMISSCPGGGGHHLTQTSTSIFANSSLGLIPHSLGVTSSHLRPSILGSKYE